MPVHARLGAPPSRQENEGDAKEQRRIKRNKDSRERAKRRAHEIERLRQQHAEEEAAEAAEEEEESARRIAVAKAQERKAKIGRK